MEMQEHPPSDAIMIRHSSALLATLAVSACVSVGTQQPSTGGQQESLHTAIARLALETPEFGSISFIPAKIINATISAPIQRQRPFGGAAYTYYCVRGYIENPMFPIHQSAYADVEVTEHGGRPTIIVNSKRTACAGTGFVPFPEIEQLSVTRSSS
jgi:hypothetical protein